ncbi:unnamed protein product, partial [Prorocentrum cordatum]
MCGGGPLAATARPGDIGGGSSRRPPGAATWTKRMHELIMLGEVSLAAAAASGPGKLVVGAEARARLASLFPEAGAPRMPPPPQHQPETWEADAAEEAAGHLNKFPQHSRPGLTGARFEHWATLRGNANGKEALAQLLAVTMRGEAPPAASRALLGGRRIPLQKPGGGVRPLACGQTLRRIAAKAAMTKHKELIAQALGPHKYGVGRRNGVEVMHKLAPPP